MQPAPEFGGEIKFPIGKGARAAEAVHDTAGSAADAAFRFSRDNGADALPDRIAAFDHGNFQLRMQMVQLICRKNSGGSPADNDYVVVFQCFSSFPFLYGAVFGLMPNQRHRRIVKICKLRIPLRFADKGLARRIDVLAADLEKSVLLAERAHTAELLHRIP